MRPDLKAEIQHTAGPREANGGADHLCHDARERRLSLDCAPPLPPALHL